METFLSIITIYLFTPFLAVGATDSGSGSGLATIKNISVTNIDLSYYLHWDPFIRDDDDSKSPTVYNVRASFSESPDVKFNATTNTTVNFPDIWDRKFYILFNITASIDGVQKAQGQQYFMDLQGGKTPVILSPPLVELSVNCSNMTVSLKPPVEGISHKQLAYTVQFFYLSKSSTWKMFAEEEVKYELRSKTTSISQLSPGPKSANVCVAASLEILHGIKIQSGLKRVCTPAECKYPVFTEQRNHRVTIFVAAAVCAILALIALVIFLAWKYWWSSLKPADVELPDNTKQVIGVDLNEATASGLRRGDNFPDEIAPTQETLLTVGYRTNEESTSLIPNDVLRINIENFSYNPEDVDMIDWNVEIPTTTINVPYPSNGAAAVSALGSCLMELPNETTVPHAESRCLEIPIPVYQNSNASSNSNMQEVDQEPEDGSPKNSRHARTGSEDSAFCDELTCQGLRLTNENGRSYNESTESDHSADEGYIKFPIQSDDQRFLMASVSECKD